MSHTKLSTAAAALAMALAAPLAAQAAEGLRVVRDPQTGELRGPTAAEAAAFQKAEEQLRSAKRGKAAATALAAQQEITYADGTVEMKLDEDSHMYSVATLSADGSVRTHCLPAKEAKALVKMSSKKSVAMKAPGKVTQ